MASKAGRPYSYLHLGLPVMEPGFLSISAAEYHADPCPTASLNAGTLKELFLRSPLHAYNQHPRLNLLAPRYESGEFDLGSAAHAMLFEGGGAIVPVDAPDWRTKAARERRDEIRSEGKIPVLLDKLTEITAMARSAADAMSECEIPINLAGGDAEQVIAWQESGLWCRARLDWIKSDRSLIIDYKTTSGSARPDRWSRSQMFPLGYDLQAVHYLRGLRAAANTDATFIFVVQEISEPYACSFVSMSPAMLAVAEENWKVAFGRWESGINSGKWPGYTRRVCYVEPTAWQLAGDESAGMIAQEQVGE